ncbi:MULTISPECIES: hypothetical protein [Hansschlegelia]|uniref:Uncharacterized protein n=1 Tax=Hansschlegelia zhihuaiae TaxID=405005 RepID=A0A4Q0MEV2_9HYPH|nr:hypothetical protein [Hansschlegelia zhihuaiae]RXF71459.1 hypothetical protein EK403_15425 [Hansschlegelia zhihuaiae]
MSRRSDRPVLKTLVPDPARLAGAMPIILKTWFERRITFGGAEPDGRFPHGISLLLAIQPSFASGRDFTRTKIEQAYLRKRYGCLLERLTSFQEAGSQFIQPPTLEARWQVSQSKTSPAVRSPSAAQRHSAIKMTSWNGTKASSPISTTRIAKFIAHDASPRAALAHRGSARRSTASSISTNPRRWRSSKESGSRHDGRGDEAWAARATADLRVFVEAFVDELTSKSPHC